jgi:G3E family GTPase
LDWPLQFSIPQPHRASTTFDQLRPGATDMPTAKGKVPVTVLTGFLGSGKTTLLNRILSENHGRRIAVIENEFGEVGVDNELVIGAEEEIFEMNNGCICCNVRGDLIRILGSLMKRREKFDYILIETTGMADPGPVAQTFFRDEDLQDAFQLDGIITLVDTKHVVQHIDDSHEVKEQIAFADVILLNKTDLVESVELEKLESRIRSMNAVAKVFHTQNAQIPIDQVLRLGAFDLDRALDLEPDFLGQKQPFAWSGQYPLNPGTYTVNLKAGPSFDLSLCVLPVDSSSQRSGMGSLIDSARQAFGTDTISVKPSQPMAADGQLFKLLLIGKELNFTLPIEQTGLFTLFCNRDLDRYCVRLVDATGQAVQPTATCQYNLDHQHHDHQHDDEVTSVGITHAGELSLEKFQEWLNHLLADKGQDIFRMKGILNFKDCPDRYVFQGVHMLFDGRPDRPWGTDLRKNSLIFIGRKLDRQELNAGFQSCLT